MWRISWQAQLLATSLLLCCIVLNYHRCNGECERRSDCCMNINDTMASVAMDELCGCVCVHGDVVIDFSDQSSLGQRDFTFLNDLENVTGVFSLENAELSSPIEIQSLQHIGGIKNGTALRVFNISGWDIIFPKLATITRGDAKFEIIDGMCGFRSINWTKILLNGSLIGNDSTCTAASNCSGCPDNYCWTEQYCQFPSGGGGGGGDDSFFDKIADIDRVILIGVGAAIIVILILLLCCCCIGCCCYCRKRRDKYTTSMKAVSMENVMVPGMIRQQSQTVFELPSLKIVSEPKDPPKLGKISVVQSGALEQSQLIGNGSCGQVYKGHWHTDRDTISYLVAIKVFGTPSTNYQEAIIKKLEQFSVLEHENVLRLCSVSVDTQLILAYEYLPYNLRQYLMMNKLTLSAKDLISLATQIAKGMAYLSSKGISHGNLAARNVMIQQISSAKITDYNLYDLTVQSDWLPVRWLAPETLKYRKYDEKSDMWSYGVTVWEIMTFGAQPYHGKPISDILKALECNERLPQPVTATAELHSILVSCWWLDPIMRPTFDGMVKNFTTFQSNPSQYVLTMVDGKLETYLKLPPSISDVSSFENLSEIDEAGYMKMLPVGSVPSSPSNTLEAPNRHTSTLASISSGNVMEDGTMVTTFMSNNIRVKDEQYEKVTATTDETDGMIYANPDQDEIYANEDDVYVNNEDEKKEEAPYSSADQPTVDEVYVNPVPNEDQLYTDVGPSEEQELYIDPETMTNRENKLEEEELYENPNEKEATKSEDELYVTPEHVDNTEDETYVSQGDDQTTLLDHDDRGYEKMKKGVSINDLNAEYVYATRDDHVRVNNNASGITDDGYQIMKGSAQTGTSQQPSMDEEYVEVTPGKQDFRESQIYSSVQ